MRLFLALWGKSECLPSVPKYAVVVHAPGRPGALRGSEPVLARLLPRARGPASLCGSVAHTATVGAVCSQLGGAEALAGPEQNTILIKTTSSHQPPQRRGVSLQPRTCPLRSHRGRPWEVLWVQLGAPPPARTP